MHQVEIKIISDNRDAWSNYSRIQLQKNIHRENYIAIKDMKRKKKDIKTIVEVRRDRKVLEQKKDDRPDKNTGENEQISRKRLESKEERKRTDRKRKTSMEKELN